MDKNLSVNEIKKELTELYENGEISLLKEKLIFLSEDERKSVKNLVLSFESKMVKAEEERHRILSMIDFDVKYKPEKHFLVCGVDEAGRGPIAGPVCAAAVILPENFYVDGINDSKKMTESARDRLYEIIVSNAFAYKAVLVSSAEIDATDILSASLKAMAMAVEGLETKPDVVLIDGNIMPNFDKKDFEAYTIVKGDAKSISISAASIIAKVTRDRLMYQYAEAFPEYGFDKHKGYGTSEHYEAIAKYGVCPIHRNSFRLFEN